MSPAPSKETILKSEFEPEGKPSNIEQSSKQLIEQQLSQMKKQCKTFSKKHLITELFYASIRIRQLENMLNKAHPKDAAQSTSVDREKK